MSYQLGKTIESIKGAKVNVTRLGTLPDKLNEIKGILNKNKGKDPDSFECFNNLDELYKEINIIIEEVKEAGDGIEQEMREIITKYTAPLIKKMNTIKQKIKKKEKNVAYLKDAEFTKFEDLNIREGTCILLINLYKRFKDKYFSVDQFHKIIKDIRDKSNEELEKRITIKWEVPPYHKRGYLARIPVGSQPNRYNYKIKKEAFEFAVKDLERIKRFRGYLQSCEESRITQTTINKQ